MTPRDRTHDAGSPATPKRPSRPNAVGAALLTVVPQAAPAKKVKVFVAELDTKIRDLAAKLCTEAEIIEALELRSDVFEKDNRRFAFEKGRSLGMAALRGAQLNLAETSAPMAIFLGRVYLGQSERREVDPSGSNEIAEVAQNVRERLAALVAEANQRRYTTSGSDRGDA